MRTYEESGSGWFCLAVCARELCHKVLFRYNFPIEVSVSLINIIVFHGFDKVVVASFLFFESLDFHSLATAELVFFIIYKYSDAIDIAVIG